MLCSQLNSDKLIHSKFYNLSMPFQYRGRFLLVSRPENTTVELHDIHETFVMNGIHALVSGGINPHSGDDWRIK